jgi:hypothetical protein
MRAVYVCGLVWIGLFVVRSESSPVIIATWLAGLLLSVSALVLLHRAGVRFVRRRASWHVDGDISRNFYRDVLWLPRR